MPREFLSRYGRPVVSTHFLNAATPVRVQPDDDRYLIGFMIPTNVDPIFIFPDSENDTNQIGFNLVSAGGIELFHHDSHGSLVNLGWTVFCNLGPHTLTVVQGFMRPTLPTGVSRGSKT